MKKNSSRGRPREGNRTDWNSPLCHSVHAPVTKPVLRRFTSRRVFILFIFCHYLLQDFKREVPEKDATANTNSPAARDATQHPAARDATPTSCRVVKQRSRSTVLFFNATETDGYCEFIKLLSMKCFMNYILSSFINNNRLVND